jgi:cytochrome P450
MQAASVSAPLATVSIAELERDPHTVLRQHRMAAPFFRHESGAYFVLRFKDVEQLLRDPRMRQTETEYPKLRGINGGILLEVFEHGMLTSNGAVHRRRRAPFTRTFAARLIAALRPAIRQTAGELIDAWPATGEADLVEDFAAQIPARTISALLGLPRADIPRFTRLVYSVSRLLSFTFAPEDVPEIEAAAQGLYEYVDDLLRTRRQGGTEDFLSSYVLDVDEKNELSPVEAIMQIVTLIVGGTDTTRVAMAGLVALLLQHRHQWDAVCIDPALIPGAVVESLRYEPSVASVSRIALEDIDLGSHVLPRGSFAMLSTMSAMRDDAVYADPDRFDIHRTGQPRLHPVFGGGANRCLGEALAIAELEEGLSVLASRVPQLRLAGPEPRLQGHSGIRRIGKMRVRWAG